MEASIEGFTGITGLPRENALEWLKANSNDVERAVNAWVDNPSPWPPKPPQSTWKESEFHADNTANSTGADPSSFHVHPPDTLTPGVFGAPSRPPSPVDNRGGNAGNVQAHPRYVETEDEQMTRAMAMSLNESQGLQGQETGVTDFDRPTFGPAERESYDPSQWAMTVSGTQAQEIILDPDPSDRRRDKGSPAYLKPTPSNDRLAAFVKILHEIPLAREALLNRSHTIPDYGINAEWWAGTAIKILRVVNLDQNVQDTYGEDVLLETQRLMAFLDKTERAYGSVDVLANLLGMTAPVDKIGRFLQYWHDFTEQYAPEADLKDVFMSKGVKRELDDSGEFVEQCFHSLPVRVEQLLVDRGMSLYDALDELLWANMSNNEVYLEEVADVLTFEVSNPNANSSGLGIDVPSVWYSDRYLESSIVAAKEMRKQKMAVEERLEQLENQRDKLTSLRRPGTGKIEASDLMAKATSYFEDTLAYRDSEKDVSGTWDQGSSSRLKEMVEDLKHLSERISHKLSAFEKTKQDAQKQLREISKFNTEPTNDPENSPTHKYTLRGVATVASTVYVLEKPPAAAHDDLLSFDTEDWQWWKLEYNSSELKPVAMTKVSETDVLQAARTESPSALLVYASERAIAHESSALPIQLNNFVRADNLGFSAELDQSLRPQSSELSPGKRKAMDSDSDDMITQHPDTPPISQDLSDDEPDPDSPGYGGSMSTHPAPARTGTRPLRPKIPATGGGTTDDLIPLSLQGMGGGSGSGSGSGQTQGTSLAGAHFASLGDDSEQGREMEERSGSRSGGGVSGGAAFQHARRKPGDGGSGGYKLGSYTPEISMDDVDEGEEGDDDEDEDKDKDSAGKRQRARPRQGRPPQASSSSGNNNKNKTWVPEPERPRGRGTGTRDDDDDVW